MSPENFLSKASIGILGILLEVSKEVFGIFLPAFLTQIEVMKSNVESRVKVYEQELEKFAARWHQLKPGDDALDGDRQKCLAAVGVIKEKKQEFEELEKTREALV